MLWECVALIVMVFGVLFPLEPLWVSPLQSEPLMIPLNELLGELLTPILDVLDHVPTREAVEHELPCEWFASSSVATDELANHGHGISISTTSLVGDTYTWRPAEYEDVKASGVLSCSKYGEHCAGDGGKQGNGHIHIDVSHGHSASISATGGNARHENRPPFTVVNRWKRTA